MEQFIRLFPCINKFDWNSHDRPEQQKKLIGFIPIYLNSKQNSNFAVNKIAVVSEKCGIPDYKV